MSDLVSVVIPVYNVEKYLSRCLESIVSQTYTNIQIILVNDGSIDGSEEICQKYKKRDNRIEYIYQENQGLAGARNTGIGAAKGKYIVFVDSDDYVSDDYVSKLYNLILNYDADISMCSCLRTMKSDERAELKDYPLYVYKGEEFIRHMYDYDVLEINIACNKMYKTSLFENDCFPIGKLHEDFVLNTKLMYNANCIAYTKEPLYFYYQSAGSITRRKITKRNLDCVEQTEKRLDYFKEIGEDSLYRRCLLDYEVVSLKFYYLYKRDVKDSRRECRSLMNKYRSYFGQAFRAKEINWTRKVFISLGFLFPYFMGMATQKIFKIE